MTNSRMQLLVCNKNVNSHLALDKDLILNMRRTLLNI